MIGIYSYQIRKTSSMLINYMQDKKNQLKSNQNSPHKNGNINYDKRNSNTSNHITNKIHSDHQVNTAGSKYLSRGEKIG